MKMLNWMFLGVFAFAAGCSDSPVVQESVTTGVPDSSPYLADVEPEGALPVGDARESVKDDQAVTLVGVIGGSSKPFVDGLAAFTIVDPKVPYCSADEGCPTPWDYCCKQDQVKGNIATVKIVDDTGKPVSANAREILNVNELSTVVVQGTARRDEQGNLTVAATKVFVRPRE
jgi:hypothetical protein